MFEREMSPRGSIARAEAVDRHAQAILLFVFVALLGGRFTLDRLGAGLPGMDPRWPAVCIAALAVGMWRTAGLHDVPQPIRAGPGPKLFLLWCFYTALTAFWSAPAARVEANLVDLLFLASFIWLAGHLASRMSDRALSTIWTWFVIAGLIYFLGAVLGGPDEQGRYSAFSGGANVFVRVMLLGALGALYHAIRHRRFWGLWILPIYLVGAVMSGSRGGLISFVAASCIAGIPLLRKIPIGPLFGLLSALGVAFAFLYGPILALLQQSGLYRRFVTETVVQRYDSGRGEIFSGALGLAERHPFFGAGLDAFYAQIGYKVQNSEYAHNLILAALSDGGIVALALFLSAFGSLLRAAYQRRPLSIETRFAVIAGLFIFCASLFSGTYYDSRFMWFALVISSIEGSRLRSGNPRPKKRFS